MTEENQKLHIREKIAKERFYIDNDFVDKKFLAFLGKGANVYATLARHANYVTQKCFLRYETLMEESGVRNRNKVSKFIQLLQNMNMILIEKTSRRKCLNYILIDKAHWKLPSSIPLDTARVVSKRNREQYQKQHQSSTPADTLNELKKETNGMNDFSHKGINEKIKELGDSKKIKSSYP